MSISTLEEPAVSASEARTLSRTTQVGDLTRPLAEPATFSSSKAAIIVGVAIVAAVLVALVLIGVLISDLEMEVNIPS